MDYILIEASTLSCESLEDCQRVEPDIIHALIQTQLCCSGKPTLISGTMTEATRSFQDEAQFKSRPRRHTYLTVSNIYRKSNVFCFLFSFLYFLPFYWLCDGHFYVHKLITISLFSCYIHYVHKLITKGSVYSILCVFFSELPAATKNVAIRVVTVMLRAKTNQNIGSTLLQCSAE